MSELDKIRIDKWLWHARFFKTRALAAKVITGGHMRIDGRKIAKPATAIRPGVTLTFLQAERVRIIQIEAISTRRGPAPEAQALYLDLTPAEVKGPDIPIQERGGRPTKQERRMGARFKRGALD